MATDYIVNHEPLQLDEIADLLREAKEDKAKHADGSGSRRHWIQNRLCRGVVGSTTPFIAGSDADRAQGQIDELYVMFLHGSGPGVDELAMQLYRLMQAGG